MKPSQIYVGLKVVTSDQPDATLYTVHQIEDKHIGLRYSLPSGTHVWGGWTDASLLKLPTIQQMAN
jgi:hypothetical protein